MIEWKCSKDELPAEDGYCVVWSARPFIAWYDSKNKMWEFKEYFKISAESNAVTHWYKIDEPKR